MSCPATIAEILIINAPACIAAIAAAAIGWSNRRRLGFAATELHQVAEVVKNGHDRPQEPAGDLKARAWDQFPRDL